MRGGGKGGSDCDGGGCVLSLSSKRLKGKDGDGAIKIEQIRTRGGEGAPNFGNFCDNVISECPHGWLL